MRKTIYVPDDFDWDGLVLRARENGESVSQYLLGFKNRSSNIGQMDRIESKLDRLLSDELPPWPNKNPARDRYLDKKADEVVDKILSDDPTLRESNDELKVEIDDGMEMLAKRRDEINSIRAKKIAMTKGSIRSDSEVMGDVLDQFGRIRKPMPKGGKK